MKRSILAALTLSLCFCANAQKFVHEEDFSYRFDNREFDRGDNLYMNSMTINAFNARIMGGLKWSDLYSTQRLMGGFTLQKDMGQGTYVYDRRNGSPDTWALFKEMLFFYEFDRHLNLFSHAHVRGAFGVYPSSLCTEDYSQAFVSDSLKFYDTSYEGMMFSYASRRAHAEIALDWMGLKDTLSRERFRVFGGARYRVCRYCDAGLHFSMYHFAGSRLTPGVVDNVLLNPFVRADVGSLVGLNELSLKAGMLVGYQRERKFEDVKRVPVGFEGILRARWRRLGLEDSFYAGDDQMPHYNTFLYGRKLGADLYFGSPFYRCSVYDRLEAFWAPRISSKVSLKISCVFNFASCDIPYQGTQQILTLKYNL